MVTFLGFENFNQNQKQKKNKYQNYFKSLSRENFLT